MITTPPASPAAPVTFADRLKQSNRPLRRTAPRVLQLNVGKRCNLTCAHCHVDAGPRRVEMMARATVDRVLAWQARHRLPVVDITGGAPEMLPDFRHLVRTVRSLDADATIIDRCNLTILLEPGQEDLAAFLASQRVQIIASLPCYTPDNVDAQRGDGVFTASIAALRQLNTLGYGRQPALPLHLVYNPGGAALPGPQPQLEADYKRELADRFGVVFDRLLALANLPIGRFAAALRHAGQYDAYLALLAKNFNPATVDGLMCRDTISVDWRGALFDCDFNQMLGRPMADTITRYLWELDPARLADGPVATGTHCFGCTAGAGSSCGGALT